MKIDVWCNVSRKETLEVDDRFKSLLEQENDILTDELFEIVSQIIENNKTDDEYINEVCGVFEAETNNCLFEI